MANHHFILLGGELAGVKLSYRCFNFIELNHNGLMGLTKYNSTFCYQSSEFFDLLTIPNQKFPEYFLCKRNGLKEVKNAIGQTF